MHTIANNTELSILDESYMIVKEFQMAVKLDEENMLLLVYDFNFDLMQINYKTEGILNRVNKELGLKIESCFKIQLADYGVEFYDETLNMDIF